MTPVIPPTQIRIVPEYRLEALQAKIAKLAARARKLGVEIPTYEVIPGIVVEEFARGQGMGTFKVPCVRVRVSTTPVTWCGWVFCGYLEHFEQGNRLYAMEDLPEWCRTVKSQCDHCHTVRNRNGTYIVRDEETGEYRQVGSGCLDDFVGEESAASAAASCEAVRDLYNFFDADGWGLEGVSRQELGVHLRELLCYCAEDICRSGYRSRKNAELRDETPTGDLAFMLLDNPRERKRLWPDIDEPEILARHGQLVDKVVAYWLDADPRSDFDHNAVLLAKRGVAKGRDGNMAAAMVSVYHRRQADLALAAQRKNEFLGREKERVELEIVLDSIIPCHGMYESFLHIMRDPENRLVKWFASSSSQGMEPGRRYRIAATVKKHDEREGQKSTILTRCSVKQVLREAAS